VSPVLQAVLFFTAGAIFGVVMAALQLADVIGGGPVLAVVFLVGAAMSARMAFRGMRMLRGGTRGR
jgi:hypothetical protein